MKLLEPVTILASHLEAGSLQMRDMLAKEHSLANFYLAETSAQKEEDRKAQEDLARLFGVKT